MNIPELFNESLTYPTKDIDKLLTLGVLFFLEGLISLLPSVTIALNQDLATQILYFISNIVGIIVTLIVFGYALSIVKNTIYNSSMPSIKIIKNIIDGIKLFVISIIFYILPSTITLIIAYFTGVLNGILDLTMIYLNYGPEVISHISHLTSLNFNMNVFIGVVLIGAVLFILATLFLIIAIARFADTNNMRSSFNFKEIINDINNISWKNYLLSLVLFLIILLVILIVTVVVSIIPFVGLIIFFLVILPFIIIFSGRTLGLIYIEKEDF